MKTILKKICLLVYAGVFLVGGCVGGTIVGIELTNLKSGETLREGDSIPSHFPVVVVFANEKGQQELMVVRWESLSQGTYWKSKTVTYLVPQNQGTFTGGGGSAKFTATTHSADRQTVEVHYQPDIIGIFSLHSRYEATPDKISPRYYKQVEHGPIFGTVAVFMALLYGFLYFLNRKILTLVSRLIPEWTPKKSSVLSSLAEATTELIFLRTEKSQQQQPPAS